MIEKIITLLKEHKLEYKKFLLAVSGGADSMLLAKLFLDLKLTFGIAHINYQLRKEDSNLDEKLVADFCTQNKIPFYCKSINTNELLVSEKKAIQELARDIRYDFFNEIATQHQYEIITTAHHKDDQVETILFRLCRGTGLQGLMGMKIWNGTFFRPLLAFSKEEILNEIDKRKIPFREDTSNKKNDYVRNFLRNEIIPKLNEKIPNVGERIYRTAERLAQYNDICQAQIDKIKNKLLTIDAGMMKIPIRALEKAKPQELIFYELFSSFGFSSTQYSEILKLCKATNSSHITSESHKLIKDRNHLLVIEKSERTQFYFSIENNYGRIETPIGILEWESSTKPLENFNNDKNLAFIDKAKMQGPIIFRSIKQGDYFYPLGMEKKKKLARFLIDIKANAEQKKQSFVLENNKKILWFVQYRIDNRFKISEKTKEYFIFKMIN